MGNVLPSLGRRKLPMLEMPKLGGGGGAIGLGSIAYAASQPDSSYTLCDGSFIPYPSKAGFPFVGISAANQNNLKTLPGLDGGQVYNTIQLPDGSIFTATSAGLYVSTDGGATFSLSPSLVNSGRSGPVFAFAYANSVYLAAWQGTIARSSDGGATWANVRNVSGNISAFATDGAGLWYAVSSGNYNGDRKAYRSTDNGVNWSEVNSRAATSLNCQDVSYIGSGQFVVSMGDGSSGYGIVRLVTGAAFDTGVGFNNQTSSQTIQCAAYGNGRLVVCANGRAWVKPDPLSSNFSNSGSWTMVTVPNGGNGIVTIAFCKDRFIISDTGGKAFSSADGLSWVSLSAIDASGTWINNVSFIQSGRIFIGNQAGKLYELIISAQTFKLPSLGSLVGINGKTLNPYMKVA